MDHQALPIEQTAEALQCSEKTIRDMIHRGHLFAVKTGVGRGHWRVPVQALNLFLQGRSPMKELVG
jgi:excisionase family DNA binding protein